MIYKKYQIGFGQKFRRQKLRASVEKSRSIQLCICCGSKCDANKSWCCDFLYSVYNQYSGDLVYVFDEEI